MRILITGHRGFVGRELIKAYDAYGEHENLYA